MLPELGTYTVTILLRAQEQISQAVNKATNAMKKMQGVSGGLSTALGRVRDMALGVVSGMIGFEAINQVIQNIRESIELYAGLEKRMTALAAITRETGQDIGKLSRDYMEAAIRSAREFGVSIEESSMAFDSLVRAGLSGAEAMQALNAVLAISQIEGVNAAQVADILAATLNQFSLRAEDAWKVADALTNAAAIGVSTMTQYANGLSYVGAVANQLGFSLDETLGMLVAVDASIKDATKSGRYLQAALSALVEKSDKLGFSIYDANGKMLSMTEIIAKLYEYYRSLGTEQERNAYLFKVFGEQGARAVAAIFSYIEQYGGDARQVLSDLISKVGEAGTALETTQKIMETTAGKLAQMNERIEEAQIALGEALAPAVIEAANSLIVLSDVIAVLNGDLSRLSKDHLPMLTKQLENMVSYGPTTFGLGGAFRYLWENVLQVNKVVENYVKSQDEAVEKIESVDRKLIEQARSYQQLIEQQNKATQALEQHNQVIRETIDSTLEYSDLVEKLAREFDLPIEKVDQLARQVLGLNFVYDEHAKIKDLLINKYGVEAGKVDLLISRLEAEAEAQKNAAESADDHSDSLENLGKTIDPLTAKLERMRKIMDAWGGLELNISYLTSRVNAALDARRALYLESGDALEALNEIFSHNADYVRDHMNIVLENVKVLQEQGFMTQEQVKRFEELLPRVHRNREAYEELKMAVEEANEAYQKQISLTREQEITMERLRVIGEHLSLVQQGIQLQMQAMTLEALGNTEAAEKLREAWSKVKDALEDGTITADEFQDILSALSETPFDISFDLTPLDQAFTNLTTNVTQKFMELTTNVAAKVNEELTPKIQEAAQTVQATVSEAVAPAMDTWIQKIAAVQGGYGGLLENTLPQVITKISEMGGLFATMKDETLPQLIQKHNEMRDKIIEDVKKICDWLGGMVSSIHEVRDAFNPGVVTAVQAAINKVAQLKEKIEKLPSEKHITIYIHEKKAKEGGGTGGGGSAPSAQHGAWYTREGLYYVHRGEMILPRSVAEWFRRGGGVAASQKVVNVTIGDIIVNYNGFEGIRDIRDLAEAISREMVRRWRAAL